MAKSTRKIMLWLKINFSWLLLVVLATLLISTMFKQGCKQEINPNEVMIQKLDSLINIKNLEKTLKLDTLIIEKHHETKIVKQIEKIKTEYRDKDNFIDTIPVIMSTERSPFAKSKLEEWKLRSDTGYYDIPK